MRLDLKLAFLLVALGISQRGFGQTPPAERWTAERANTWYNSYPWLAGCDYIPANAVNQLEMWQADTFSPEVIDKELDWAEQLGFNVMRVYLHHAAWQQDPKGFKQRMDKYLSIAWKHKIWTIFVFLDDCWLPTFQIGKQPDPKPAVHNSGWLQDPGAIYYGADAAGKARVEKVVERYVKDVMKTFKDDRRVLMWDLYNEPTNSYRDSCHLVEKMFEWGREINPSQPLTVDLNDWRLIDSEAYRMVLDRSDIVTFHDYGPPEDMQRWIDRLKQYGRPIICSEYMARTRGCTFQAIMPMLKANRIGAINWGFVAGKTNTFFPWGHPETPGMDEPPLWFHDILRPDGRPYKEDEAAFIKEMTTTGYEPVAVGQSSSDIRLLDEAKARIEQMRKGEVEITVTHNGKPVEGARVHVNMLQSDFLFGCNIFAWEDKPNSAYNKAFAELFNFATLGFYWPSYEPENGKPNYAYSEKVAAWCAAHNIRTKGHPLVWNTGDPAWINDMTDEDLYARLLKRATECASHFRGNIDTWDVINELVTWKNKRNSPRLTRFGANAAGIVQLTKDAFAAARKGNPDATLILNDYKLDSQALDSLLLNFNDAKGKPIYDVLGIQSHMHPGHRWSGHVNDVWPSEYAYNICERFAKFGRPINFTEMTVLSTTQRYGDWSTDVPPEGLPTTPEGEAKQCSDVVRLYTILFSHPAVTAITWWDLSDRDAWRNVPAGLLRKDMSPKPAYHALRKLIKEDWETHTTVTTNKQGIATLRAFRGTYQLTVTMPDGQVIAQQFDARVKEGINKIAIKNKI